ncbi:MAG: DUF2796 domain-containing protein [Tateyamaria sp.]|nr:DUF2796 domain-containing protein [Tateyamaria sp.]
MKTILIFGITIITSYPLLAESTRQLESHEHGVGQLEVAIEGQKIAIDLHAPGADIVGFEYVAESSKDRKAVDTAITILGKPLDLFLISSDAKCNVMQAAAELESDDEHDEHQEKSAHTEFHASYILNCMNIAAMTEIKFAYFDLFPNTKELEVQMISDVGAFTFEIEREEPTLDLIGKL